MVGEIVRIIEDKDGIVILHWCGEDGECNAEFEDMFKMWVLDGNV